MTDIQTIGTHNSYHVGLGENELAALRKVNPAAADSLAYRHAPLEQQLDWGVRQFELDVFGDSKGGLFSNPAMPRRLAAQGLPTDPPFDPAGKLQKPGFKVLHVADIDFRSSCLTLIDCLTTFRDWSRRHPGHLPIYVLLENKDGKPRGEDMVAPEPITKATLEALDQEILSVFRREELITPDDVRQGMPTLEAAVLARGWPALAKARGKFVFLLDQERVTKLYTDGHPNLEGRVMFTNGTPGTPDAAFVKANNPTGPAGERIAELVRKGYLIRTMTDGGPANVRAGNAARRDAAFANGAHLLSTDYPYGWKSKDSGYSVQFSSGIARCNPVVPQNPCGAADLVEAKN
ncbi:MAG: phosphatidylinositol-specific phospholipase C1-like protein [Bryobacter sp.]